MVTGNSFDDVQADLDVPTTHAEMHGYLLRNFRTARVITILDDITVSRLRDRDDLFFDGVSFDDRTMILTVESPSDVSDWHAVVVHKGDVYDPSGVWDDIEQIEDIDCTWGFSIPRYSSY
jgi:hypothetical protein